MATRQRLPLYQLYLSLATTVYALCYPPRRLEEHLRALETLDNMALFYSALGCYTFSVFLLVYWGVIPLAASFVTRVFGALFWTLGACDKGLQYLKYAIVGYLHRRCRVRDIETSLDWNLREEHYKLNIAGLQKSNDALDTNLDTAVKAHSRTRSALKKEKARARKRETEIKRHKRANKGTITRLHEHGRTLATRIADNEAVIDARDAHIRQLETKLDGANDQINGLLKQLACAEALAHDHATSAEDLNSKTLDQEATIKGLNVELEQEKRARGYWTDRARENAETVDTLQDNLVEQEDTNCKLMGELGEERLRARAAEDKVRDLNARNVALQATIENSEAQVTNLKENVAELTVKAENWECKANNHESEVAEWKARATVHEDKAVHLENHTSELKANILNLRTEVAHLETRSKDFAAKAEDWKSKARAHERNAAEWKTRATQERARADSLETRKHELGLEAGDLSSRVAEHELRAIALVTEVDDVKAGALGHENAAQEWEALATKQKDRADRLEDRAADLELAILELKGSLVDRDNTIEALETRSREFAVKLSDVDDRAIILEAEAHEWEDLAHEHEAAAHKWKTRATELEAKADGLANSVTELEARALDLGNALTKAEVKASRLDTHFRTELARAQTLEARALELEDSAMNWEMRAIKAEDTANEWEARMDEHIAKADAFQIRVDELEADVLARDNRISVLKTSVDDRDVRLKAAELTSCEWKAHAIEQECKTSMAEARVRELEITVGALDSRINEQERAKAVVDQYVTQVEADLAASQQVIAVFIERFREGRDTIKDLTHHNTGISAEYEQLKARVLTLEHEAQKASKELAEARAAPSADMRFDLDSSFDKDADLDASTLKWNALEEQLAVMEAETSTFLISDIVLDFEVKDKQKAKEDITDWLESEIECLKYRLNAAQGELRTSAAKVEEAEAKLARSTEELESQKRINIELEKARDALQAKQIATPARVQALKAQKPAATPLAVRSTGNSTPNKRVLATPKAGTPSVRTQSTRTSGQRENLSPAALALQKDRDALKVKLAASEKNVHDLKAQLADSSNKAGALQAELDKAILVPAHGGESGTTSTDQANQGDEIAQRLSRRIADLELECAMLKCRATAANGGGSTE